MKKLHAVLILFALTILSLLCASSVSAAPISGLEQTVTQPDGTEIHSIFAVMRSIVI